MTPNKYFIIAIVAVTLAIFVYLLVTYYQIDSLALPGAPGTMIAPILNMSALMPFPIEIYTLVLNGAGTTSTELSVSRDNEAIRLKEDVKYGKITYLMIQGHPYTLKYAHDTKYFITFAITHACNVFPFPQCSTSEPITDIISTVVQALGYKPS
jgi:hypothetical protein